MFRLVLEYFHLDLSFDLSVLFHDVYIVGESRPVVGNVPRCGV